MQLDPNQLNQLIDALYTGTITVPGASGYISSYRNSTSKLITIAPENNEPIRSIQIAGIYDVPHQLSDFTDLIQVYLVIDGTNHRIHPINLTNTDNIPSTIVFNSDLTTDQVNALRSTNHIKVIDTEQLITSLSLQVTIRRPEGEEYKTYAPTFRLVNVIYNPLGI